MRWSVSWMLLPDVNVLIYAHREELPDHPRFRKWLNDLAAGPEPFAISELVVHGFLRVVTDRRIFQPPSTIERALQFVETLLSSPACHLIRPGPRHWSILRNLCETVKPTGRLIP